MPVLKRKRLTSMALALLVAAVAAGLASCSLFTDVKVTGIVVTPEKPLPGDPLEINVTAENKGVFSASYRCVLYVDGEQFTYGDMTVPAGQSGTQTFRLPEGRAAGKHTVSVDDVEQAFTVYGPAVFEVTGITAEPAEVMDGEPVKVRVTVRNKGDLEGTYEGALMLDDTGAGACKATIAPGTEEVIELSVSVKHRGQHTFSLEGQTATVTALAAPRVDVVGLELSKAIAKPKEAVTATVTVENPGDKPCTGIVELSVNGGAAQKKEVSLEAGKTLKIPFSVSGAKAGKYTIQAGDQTKSFQVAIITRPKNGTFLVKRLKGGSNQMKIVNKYNQDIILTLVKPDKPKSALVTIYVRAKSTATIKGIPNGTYLMFFSKGTDFDSATKRFLKSAYYLKSDDTFKFAPPRGKYIIWTVTLNVSKGTGSVSNMDGSDFPQ